MAKSILFKRISRLLREAHGAQLAGVRRRDVPDFVTDPSRRAFLRMSLIGTGGLLAGCQLSVTHVTSDPTPALPNPPDLPLPAVMAEVPVVILGGGGAGLAAAYTLRKHRIRSTIYEAAGRVGGRIFTARGINSDGQFFERGAELVDTNHHALIRLAGELGLEIEDFSTEPGVKKYTGELHHIDGRTYTEHEFVRAAEPLLAGVAEAHRAMFGGKTPDLTYRAEHNDAFRRYDAMTLRAFMDGQGADAWVKKAIEIAYLCEYGRELDQQSAINLLAVIGTDPKHFSMFGESDESKRVKGGNDGIILKLHAALTGGRPDDPQICLRHRLTRLRATRGGSFVCTFATPEGTVEVATRQVICTLPFPLLREVEGIREMGLSAAKRTAIADFQIGTNSKVVNSFRSRVWRQGVGGLAPFSGAVYANSEIQNFWESSRLQVGDRGLITALLGGRVGEAVGAESIERHAELVDAVFPGSKAAFEGVGAVMNWNKMPFNRGSYTCMGPGQYGKFFGAAGEPELDGRLLFAGEHTSVEHTGFMNGAYESGIQAAEAIAARVKMKAAA